MTSSWAPLREPRFRPAWFAFLAAQVVIWAQTVGAVDVITKASGSAALVAGIQTAISLPGVLLALFAGAVADVVDRRRLLIGTTLAMTAAMAGLATLVVADAAPPGVVLALTALLGAGLAMFLPAFGASVPDIVPRDLLAQAVAITNVSVNIARAAGPALAGIVIAIAGTGGLFWVLTAVLLAVSVLLATRGPKPSAPDRPERIAAAVRAGARYARFSAPLRVILARTLLFVLFGSALWSILPLVAVRRVGLDASGFGLLLGCVGAGAVAGAGLLPRMRARMSLNAVVAFGSVVLALVLGALAVVRSPYAAALVLLVAGAAWICVLTGLLTTAQFAAPAWVRGRAVSTWMLAYQAGLAVGALLWGFVAEASLTLSLAIPAGALALTALAARFLVLPAGDDIDLEPARTWADPEVAIEVDDLAGPVLVTVEYDVEEANRTEFVLAMSELSAIRRRDGATRWNLFADLAEPGRYVETFEVATWGEHLLQHERGTQVDLPLEERAASLVQSYSVRHLVSAV